MEAAPSPSPRRRRRRSRSRSRGRGADAEPPECLSALAASYVSKPVLVGIVRSCEEAQRHRQRLRGKGDRQARARLVERRRAATLATREKPKGGGGGGEAAAAAAGEHQQQQQPPEGRRPTLSRASEARQKEETSRALSAALKQLFSPEDGGRGPTAAGAETGVARGTPSALAVRGARGGRRRGGTQQQQQHKAWEDAEEEARFRGVLAQHARLMRAVRDAATLQRREAALRVEVAAEERQAARVLDEKRAGAAAAVSEGGGGGGGGGSSAGVSLASGRAAPQFVADAARRQVLHEEVLGRRLVFQRYKLSLQGLVADWRKLNALAKLPEIHPQVRYAL